MENELCKKKTTAPDTSVGADDGQPHHNSTENSISAFEGEINGDFQNSTESLDEIYRRMQRLTDPHYLHTISMTELYQTAYQSRPPIIDGLLYAGAYILAGAPKIGKSFLVAQIAYHVSTGEALWGCEVHPGTVLYLALEDDFQRIQSRMCCCVLLAMANLTEAEAWGSATNNWIRIHDVIAFANSNYGTTYAENSRETFRKQAMHHFRNAAFIEDNGKATNSPNYRYRLTDEMLHLIQSFGTADWERSLACFMENHDSLVDLYASKRTMRKMPVKINGEDFTFSPGKHNQLQKAIIEEFAPRFAPNSECLYVGDTTEKDLVKNVDKLRALGFEITLHDKMPDVVLYSEDKDWLYFIESVTSVGPMEPKRIKEIEEMTNGVTAGKIYVTAFLDFKTFKQFSESLAWETEVWIADMPDHMIHLNGDRFLGPR